ncbi:neutral zinc metallopeptidase [Rhizobium beringeri]|uniref:KPN_02809 family neutral zinc metallopeptidase n=1 Tax=Rhizobium TaxID=379 RepID=UPI000FEC4453|nr:MULTISPECIES: neutral zinc metallopeptidase [Rhizobium]NKL62159.1 flagellar biosynthesis protein FlgM [Rhizobium leguminosarum bv. viciae]RWX04050.1 flagellar biosynthesis protein FlgM [Rhizobium leguminosarum]TBC95324.1 flagellar biosynthesis protein FlgM [Rhizobium leguminosarum]UIJ78545.1 zinc metallopeptidase [Rhizobium leguminosarum]WSG73317.1 neutral zinc metallopeptidase [Rhizobium beringeri]
MEWRGRRQSDNVEDRRGDPGGGGFGRGGGFNFPSGGVRRAGGGLSIGTIIFLVVIYFIFKMMGIDLLQVLETGGTTSGPGYEQSQSGGTRTPANDEMTAFMRTVLAETEDTWQGIFQAQGQNYEEPRLVLFSGSTASACGSASSATGPFYCPGDHKLYLDTEFFQELSDRFGASGDFAEAYVVAHEVGHHVQNLLGILPKFNQARQRMSEADANKMSVRVELQADCFAGIWGKYTQQKGLLESGDLEEALNAAQQIGDDTLQKRSQGYVVPESFNHGTSAQRVKWFKRGFDSGQLSACDTFSGPI